MSFEYAVSVLSLNSLKSEAARQALGLQQRQDITRQQFIAESVARLSNKRELEMAGTTAAVGCG